MISKATYDGLKRIRSSTEVRPDPSNIPFPRRPDCEKMEVSEIFG